MSTLLHGAPAILQSAASAPSNETGAKASTIKEAGKIDRQKRTKKISATLYAPSCQIHACLWDFSAGAKSLRFGLACSRQLDKQLSGFSVRMCEQKFLHCAIAPKMGNRVSVNVAVVELGRTGLQIFCETLAMLDSAIACALGAVANANGAATSDTGHGATASHRAGVIAMSIASPCGIRVRAAIDRMANQRYVEPVRFGDPSWARIGDGMGTMRGLDAARAPAA